MDPAVRIADHPDPNQVRHFVYNLEPARGNTVYVKRKAFGDTVNLPPNTSVAISPLPGALPKPDRIPPDDPFVAYMRARARAAGLPLQ